MRTELEEENENRLKQEDKHDSAAAAQAPPAVCLMLDSTFTPH